MALAISLANLYISPRCISHNFSVFNLTNDNGRSVAAGRLLAILNRLSHMIVHGKHQSTNNVCLTDSLSYPTPFPSRYDRP